MLLYHFGLCILPKSMEAWLTYLAWSTTCLRKYESMTRLLTYEAWHINLGRKYETSTSKHDSSSLCYLLHDISTLLPHHLILCSAIPTEIFSILNLLLVFLSHLHSFSRTKHTNHSNSRGKTLKVCMIFLYLSIVY